MEVLPSSGLQYVGESDCPPKTSEIAFLCDRKDNRNASEPAHKLEVNESECNLDLRGEEPSGEGDWMVDELLTPSNNSNGDSYSHDSGNNGSESPGGNQEGESSRSESKWLEQDQPAAAWVKWRGVWQAGIKCARSDWPLPTLRAKPTHDRKQYVVIFFPRTRNYSWADVLLVRPINEFPHPIAYRAHKVGVKMVRDLTLAQRFIMQKLSVGMLNVIEQLHIEALIETARDVMVWKDFAMEASHCKDYSDLGRMLQKLENMILKSCLNSYWVEHSLQSWVERCHNAHSAETIEMLKEELVDSILWNEVSLISNAAVQAEVGSEWKTWKQEAMKWFSISNPSNAVDQERESGDSSPLTVGLQLSRKRPKLEVRRAELHAPHVETQSTTVDIDTTFFNGRDLNSQALESGYPSEIPVQGTKGWGDTVVDNFNTESTRAKIGETTPSNGVMARKQFDPANKSRQCIAFIEAKGRQCVRWANDGDVYCCVHLASRFTRSSVKTESTATTTPVDTPMCGGTTVLGTKCKHRSLPGSTFCKKHRPRNVVMSSPANFLKRKHEESIENSRTVGGKEIVMVEQVETLVQVHEQSEAEYCLGSSPQIGMIYCLEIPKRHSLYCEKHLPSWLKRARNGKSRIISKEVFLELLRNCHSWEQKLFLHHACELFYRLFKSVLSLRNPVPKEIQFQWAISEASKDAPVREYLMKLVSREKERLNRLWGFETVNDNQIWAKVERPVEAVSTGDGVQEDGSFFRCKLCLDVFSDDNDLGKHWMDTHKKEAQWLFRGYVCAICFDSFTNKKMLEAHVKERHHVEFVEQCLLFQCIPCGSHFGNPDELWLHVLSAHPSNFRLSSTVQQEARAVNDDSSQQSKIVNPTSVDSTNIENQDGVRKFVCRFCGLKFDLLPDLGRHHQAAHMGLNSSNNRIQKRSVSYYAHKLKYRRPGRPRLKRGIRPSSYKLPNRSTASLERHHIAETNLVKMVEVDAQSHMLESASLGRLAESQCATVANILYSEIRRTKPRPSNSEILTVARSACCKVALHASLEEKYGKLPERLYLKAAKLCSEQSIVVEWHQEGFVCPRRCKSFNNLEPSSSLSLSMPVLDAVARPMFAAPSAAPPDSKTGEWATDECHCVIDFEHSTQEAVQRGIALCDDISFGRESIPIACVVDESLLGSIHNLSDGSEAQANVHSLPWEGFAYVTEPILDQFIDSDTESLQLGCSCRNSACSSRTCDHVYLFDTDYEDAKDIYGKSMNGRFPYDEKGRIVLEEGYIVYECNNNCKCSKNCQNRVLQNGVRVKLEVFKTEEKGWAVRAAEQILRGTFVCEYIGEVIDEKEAESRRKRYSAEVCSYFYDIDAGVNDMGRLTEGVALYVIDATKYGNVSRYINHSCSPNLVSYQVLVESMDCQRAHIGLYASRDIAVGEELTNDYRYKLLPGEGYRCLCGASNCRGRLY